MAPTTSPLTYCTNIHPAHSLSEVRAALAEHTAQVKRLFSPHQPFNVGLRLSGEATRQLRREPGALADFRNLLASHDFEITTLNGFPFGTFHGRPVKDRVYLPDWRQVEREVYTRDLAEVLCELLPEGKAGCISTVPGAFKSNARSTTALEAITQHLISAACSLVEMAERRGNHIVLALEPEPACLLETSDECLRFFDHQLFSPSSLDQVVHLIGGNRGTAEERLRAHLGVCIDTCHAAVEFEPALECYDKYLAAGLSVPKIQVSAGLALNPFDDEQLRAVREFDEPVYLHQVVARNGGKLTRFDDLSDALDTPLEWQAGAEWRVHFHVPLFSDEYGVFASTRGEVEPLLQELGQRQDCPLLEVETYTWDVLPERFRQLSPSEGITRELEWCRAQLGRTHDA